MICQNVLLAGFLSMALTNFIFAVPIDENGANITEPKPHLFEEDELVELLAENLAELIPSEADQIDDQSDQSDQSEQSLRIIGGSTAAPHSAPWIVSIQYVTTHRQHHFCGGAIIKPNWILTAGHCIKALPSFDHVEIVAGRHLLLSKEASEQRRKVRHVYIHPNYEGGVNPNDIALIWLSQPFNYTADVKEVTLPKSGATPTGIATLHGWGSTTTSKNSPTPNALQTMNVPLITIDQCRNALSTSARLVQSSNICTGPISGRPTACSGDSGSALTQNGVIIGTVSWGLTPCASPHTASVYVKVSSYIQWIVRTIAESS